MSKKAEKLIRKRRFLINKTKKIIKKRHKKNRKKKTKKVTNSIYINRSYNDKNSKIIKVLEHSNFYKKVRRKKGDKELKLTFHEYSVLSIILTRLF